MEQSKEKHKQKTKVVNKHHGEPFDVYIGRGSKWGNPFTHRTGTKAQFIVASRNEAVAAFREWILTQPHLLADLHELKGKTLCCYCAPQACHGHVLAEMADALPDGQPAQMAKPAVHIGFTGHRPKKLGGFDLSTHGYKTLQADLEIYIERNLAVFDTVVGHSCLALGGDTVWSKAILAMKDKHPGRVMLHAEIPFAEQPEAWFKQSDIDFWHEQVARADSSTVYGSLKGLNEAERKNTAIRLLDEASVGMIEHVNMLLALYDGSKSGTGNAVRDAEKKNVPVYAVHPRVYFS